ncbi:quinolinate synthase NadA [candidate division NPL-UPA2 bacterium]|nr:quinolinate synthase NadA [candidate division NPL-UPA2 bacterium]
MSREQYRDDQFYIDKINRLREERKAIILAHNYQRGEVQDIADFNGDSLALSREAARVDAEVIVFCGVHFMAESAAILSPRKTVLIPVPEAGCPLADMITPQGLREMKKRYPTASVVCYVNSSAQVKAESDICCTSTNAIEVVNSLESNQIIFVPDENLGRYVATQTDKELIFWKGSCPTHYRVLPEDILKAKEKHPKAKVVVHPECRLGVIMLADEVLSTGGIVKFARQTDVKEVIVGTEMGLVYRLQKENPHKRFYLATEKLICPDMKLTTLEKVANALERMEHRVTVPEEVRDKAKRALDSMLEVEV